MESPIDSQFHIRSNRAVMAKLRSIPPAPLLYKQPRLAPARRREWTLIESGDKLSIVPHRSIVVAIFAPALMSVCLSVVFSMDARGFFKDAMSPWKVLGLVIFAAILAVDGLAIYRRLTFYERPSGEYFACDRSSGKVWFPLIPAQRMLTQCRSLDIIRRTSNADAVWELQMAVDAPSQPTHLPIVAATVYAPIAELAKQLSAALKLPVVESSADSKTSVPSEAT